MPERIASKLTRPGFPRGLPGISTRRLGGNSRKMSKMSARAAHSSVRVVKMGHIASLDRFRVQPKREMNESRIEKRKQLRKRLTCSRRPGTKSQRVFRASRIAWRSKQVEEKYGCDTTQPLLEWSCVRSHPLPLNYPTCLLRRYRFSSHASNVSTAGTANQSASTCGQMPEVTKAIAK